MKPIVVSMLAAAGLILAESALATDMPPLAKKYNCVACHSIDKKLLGPAWRDISKAYNKVGATGSAVDPAAYRASNKVSEIMAKDNAKSPEEWLLHKVSVGGAGNWGSMPMPANDPSGSKVEDFKELIKFILGLEKK